MKIIITENQYKLLKEEEFKFTFLKNPEKAPYLGKRFGQDVEPSGFYCIEKYGDYNSGNWLTGEAILKKPLYIKVNNDNLVSWKYDLAKKYKKKKQGLTNKLIDDGYDGIVTYYDDDSTGEIILFKPNESIVNKEQLNEGTNRGEVYHYTYNIKDILQSNTINLSSSLGTSADKYSDKFFFLSLSRTPGVNIGYGRFHNSRLVLDGNKLNQNFKSIPVDYWGDKRGDVDRSEYEDRIISDKPTIDNISKYIIRIEIVDSEPKRKRNYQLLQLAKERNIPIFFYLNKNDLQRQRNPVNNQVEETVIDDTDTDYVPRSYKYNTDLETILSIVLYKENILDNEELLKSNVEKMIETYKLPKLSLYDIQEKMRNMHYSEWRREDYLTGLKAHLHNYFKSGQGDEFRSWIKILTSEMKKYNLTSISDLANLKFDGLKPKGKFIDYSKTYSIFYYRDGQWEKEENNNSLKSLSFLFFPTRYGGVITDDDNKNYLDFKDDNKNIGDWLNYLLNKYTLEKVQNIIQLSGYNKLTKTYEYKLDKIK